MHVLCVHQLSSEMTKMMRACRASHLVRSATSIVATCMCTIRQCSDGDKRAEEACLCGKSVVVQRGTRARQSQIPRLNAPCCAIPQRGGCDYLREDNLSADPGSEWQITIATYKRAETFLRSWRVCC